MRAAAAGQRPKATPPTAALARRGVEAVAAREAVARTAAPATISSRTRSSRASASSLVAAVVKKTRMTALAGEPPMRICDARGGTQRTVCPHNELHIINTFWSTERVRPARTHSASHAWPRRGAHMQGERRKASVLESFALLQQQACWHQRRWRACTL